MQFCVWKSHEPSSPGSRFIVEKEKIFWRKDLPPQNHTDVSDRSFIRQDYSKISQFESLNINLVTTMHRILWGDRYHKTEQ